MRAGNMQLFYLRGKYYRPQPKPLHDVSLSHVTAKKYFLSE